MGARNAYGIRIKRAVVHKTIMVKIVGFGGSGVINYYEATVLYAILIYFAI